MSSASDDRDDVDVEEDLEDVVDEVRDEVARLETMIGENVAGVHARLSKLEDRLDSFDRRLDELEDDTKIAAATSSSKKESKIEKATKVLKAADRKTGGKKGVKMSSGEVLGAAECSKSRALGLMDEIAGALEDATTKNPGGPNPKVLRVPVGEEDVEDLVDRLLEEWGDG